MMLWWRVANIAVAVASLVMVGYNVHVAVAILCVGIASAGVRTAIVARKTFKEVNGETSCNRDGSHI
jgi:hypothetical protein